MRSTLSVLAVAGMASALPGWAPPYGGHSPSHGWPTGGWPSPTAWSTGTAPTGYPTSNITWTPPASWTPSTSLVSPVTTSPPATVTVTVTETETETASGETCTYSSIVSPVTPTAPYTTAPWTYTSPVAPYPTGSSSSYPWGSGTGTGFTTKPIPTGTAPSGTAPGWYPTTW